MAKGRYGTVARKIGSGLAGPRHAAAAPLRPAARDERKAQDAEPIRRRFGGSHADPAGGRPGAGRQRVRCARCHRHHRRAAIAAQPPAFGGTVADTVGDSTAWWPPRVIPPADAPNILLIILDDAGFGVPSTFGGVIPTDTMDELAAAGLSYTSIHSTALCSPTRAALITGRNHHSVGFGVISEQSTGFPGYNSIIPRDKATIGRILLENGYNTSWFGKDHNTPAFAASQSGPFDQWPTGMGFEYFYGFVGGDANQWQPNLFRNTTQIYPFDGDPEWNLITGMADDAIDWITRMHQIDPAKPFFVKYAPAPPMRRTTRPGNGWKRSKRWNSLTTATRRCARPYSTTRRNLAWCPRARR